MKLSEIDLDNKDKWLKITDLENMFNISIDDKNNYVFNLNETLYLSGNREYLSTYQLKHDMFWPLISYKLYSTTHLAWLLMKINKVSGDEIFDIKHSGDIIYYIDRSSLQNIVKQLNDNL